MSTPGFTAQTITPYTYTWRQRIAVTGYTLTPESSTDLINWTPLSAPIASRIFHGDGTESITIPLPLPYPKQFIRLHLTTTE